MGSFKLTEDFRALSPEDKYMVRDETLWWDPILHSKSLTLETALKKGIVKFLGLTESKHLYAAIVYSPQSKYCVINGIWGGINKEFFRAHKITPPFFLVSELVRRGFVKFKVRQTTFSGNALLKRMTSSRFARIKTGLKGEKTFEILPKAVKQTKSRKYVLK